MLKPIINIYWFKRDLRLVDNVPLQMSCDEEHPTLLLYLFEPNFNTDPHHSERHRNFIKESILDLNTRLEKYKTKVHVYELNPIIYLKKIFLVLEIRYLFWNFK